MCSAVLGLQALIVLLGIVPTIVLTDLPTGWVVVVGLVLAALCVAVAGSLRRTRAYPAGFVVQAMVLATGFALPAMFVVGVIFAVLWTTAVLLGRRMEADKLRWAAEVAQAGSGEPAAGPTSSAGPPGDRPGRSR